MHTRVTFSRLMILTLALWWAGFVCIGNGTVQDAGAVSQPISETRLPAFATRFRVTSDDGQQILSIENGAAETANNSWLLIGKSDPEPEGNTLAVLRLPLTRVALLSTTFLAHFSVLNATDTICAVDNAAYAFDTGVRERIRNGSIPEIGEMDTLDLETVIHLRPDAIFVSAGMGGAPGRRDRLEKLGIPVIEIPDFLEPHPLGRAEWIKFFGLMLNRSDLAENHFNTVQTRYEGILAQAASIPAENRPTVLLHSPFQGLWHLPSADSYAVRLIQDAGGRYLFPDLKAHGARPFDFEWVFANARHANIWMQVDATSLKTLAASDPRFTRFDAYQSQQIYTHFKRTNPSGGNDFYESGVIHPDRILEDLFSIFSNWPNDVPEEKLHYFVRLH